MRWKGRGRRNSKPAQASVLSGRLRKSSRSCATDQLHAACDSRVSSGQGCGSLATRSRNSAAPERLWSGSVKCSSARASCAARSAAPLRTTAQLCGQVARAPAMLRSAVPRRDALAVATVQQVRSTRIVCLQRLAELGRGPRRSGRLGLPLSRGMPPQDVCRNTFLSAAKASRLGGRPRQEPEAVVDAPTKIRCPSHVCQASSASSAK